MRWRNPLDVLWRLLSRPFTGAILLLLSALVVLASSIIPQMPPGLSRRGADFWLWLSSLPPFWRRWSSTLLRIEGFNARNSLWFRVILGLGMLYLVVNALESAQSWWRERLLTPRELMEKGLEVHSIGTSLPPEEAIKVAGRVLKRGLYRVKAYKERTRHYFEAWGVLPPQAVRLALYSGLFLVCLGLLLAPYLDWEARVAMVSGDSLSLGNGVPVFVLENIYLSPEGGLQAEGAFFQGEEALVRGKLAWGKSLGFRGIQVHLLSSGPALRIKLEKGLQKPSLQVYPAGKEAEGEISLPFFMENEEKYIAIPDEGYMLRCVLMPGPGQSFQVELLDGQTGQRLYWQKVKEHVGFTFKGVRYTLSPENYAWIGVERSLSWWVILAGGVMICVALLAGTFLPLGKVYGFIQEEKKGVYIHWVQEDSIKLISFDKLPPKVEVESGGNPA